MLILTLWFMAFHAVTVIGLAYDILYKSTLGRCAELLLYTILQLFALLAALQ